MNIDLGEIVDIKELVFKYYNAHLKKIFMDTTPTRDIFDKIINSL